MKRTLRVVLPIVVTAIGVGVAVALIIAKPQAETRIPEVQPPLVRVTEARPQTLQFTVTSQGTVAPRTESTLVSEVSGRVVAVSPSLAAGSFVEPGEVLLRLDPTDYEQVVIRARAEVEQARVRLAREEAEAAVAVKEWRELRGEQVPPPLTSRELQVSEARAALAAAEASLRQAEIDLQRTSIRSPYAGRIRAKLADLGQFVPVGREIVRLYAVDRAEIRLPLPDDQLAYLDLPLGYRGASGRTTGPRVILRANFAGRTHAWQGRIERTEGEIDPKTRMLNVVAVVHDPYGKGGADGRPPLAVGLFVEAEIQGRRVEDVIVLPRSALRGDDRLLVVDADDRLYFRKVEILRATRDQIVVGAGLVQGERVCLSPLSAVSDGMQVRVGAAS